MTEIQTYWVYILYCDNGTYYTGYTTNLTRRYQEHVVGSEKCKYTRSFKPIAIAQAWQILADKSLALRIEKFIKKLSKREKEKLIQSPYQLKTFFCCEPYTALAAKVTERPIGL
jgi:putative endonuclease